MWHLYTPVDEDQDPNRPKRHIIARHPHTFLFCFLIFWVVINAADLVWLYYYIYTSIHPYPRTAINRTEAGWMAFRTMLPFFGFFWGCVNLLVCLVYFGLAPKFASRLGKQVKRVPGWTNFFIGTPIAIFLIIFPFFGGWIVLPMAQNVAWNHACSGFPIQVVLNSISDTGPSGQLSLARYYSGNELLYTYDIYQPTTNSWSLGLRSIDSLSLSGNPNDPLYPSISNVTYNLISNTFSANCASTSADTPCAEGSFTPKDYLTFNITDLSSHDTTYLRAVDKQWAFNGGDPPSVILQDTNGTQVIRTTFTHGGTCTQLKVCAGETNGPGIVVPMGLLLTQQQEFGVACTTPSTNND